ncbi:hypothetical protein A2U01_0088756, partial [Trifolium medium]|nr:hypothetical protein [Trifolium medium]
MRWKKRRWWFLSKFGKVRRLQ